MTHPAYDMQLKRRQARMSRLWGEVDGLIAAIDYDWLPANQEADILSALDDARRALLAGKPPNNRTDDAL